MNYQAAYDNLMGTRKDRVPIIGVYYEEHHIMPRSMGGNDEPENLVKLTAREHFLAHWMLWRIYRDRKMASAFAYMCFNTRYKKTGFTIPSRIYAEAREAAAIAAKSMMLGTTRSEETKKKIGDSQRGKKHPSKQPADIGQRIREGLLGHECSEETRDRIAKARFSGASFFMQKGELKKRINRPYVSKFLSLGWNFVKLYEKEVYCA